MAVTTDEPDRKVASAVFLGFTHALRAAGLHVGHDRARAFLAAVAQLGAGQRDDVFWAGRATLCSGPDDFVVYDRVFERWFSAEDVQPRIRSVPSRTVTQASLEEDIDAGHEGEDSAIAVLASSEETLRHRDVATLSAAERQQLTRQFAGLEAPVPSRRSMRRRPYGRGDIDAARTVRDQLRRAGEPGPLRYRRHLQRPRRVVFLIDVSGSMEPYADSLLRLAHRAVMASPRSTEVFTLGTRLTRITAAMQMRDPDKAIQIAGQTVPDWSGGTRLGDVVRAFLDRWGQRGMARGAVIVIASDGWERGDSAQLGEQMRRLHRLAHVVIWSNPHRGKAGYEPIQGGIAAALPHIDALVAGHSLASFSEVLALMADA